jgi:hypothetical protein
LKEVKNPMRLMRQTNKSAEIITIFTDKFVYNKNKLAVKNTIPE